MYVIFAVIGLVLAFFLSKLFSWIKEILDWSYLLLGFDFWSVLAVLLAFLIVFFLARRPTVIGFVEALINKTKPPRRKFFTWLAKRPAIRGWSLLGPGLLFLLFFFLIPLLLMFGYSFMGKDNYGNVQWDFTFEHYTRFFVESGKPPKRLYLDIIYRSFWNSFVCTLICLLLAYPVAYTISRAGRWKNLLMFLVVIPFWTSFLVRTFAMIFMMRGSGLINKVLGMLGMEPWTMMNTPSAVIAGLVYGFLPFMILPIYTSLEKIDMSLLEAGEVLGAKPMARFFKIILPLSLPGVVAGSLLVFIPALGSYLTSDLLGGAKQVMIGNLVQQQFTSGRNKPFGSAASFIMMSMVLVGVLYYLRTRDKKEETLS